MYLGSTAYRKALYAAGYGFYKLGNSNFPNGLPVCKSCLRSKRAQQRRYEENQAYKRERSIRNPTTYEIVNAFYWLEQNWENVGKDQDGKRTYTVRSKDTQVTATSLFEAVLRLMALEEG
jgi:hypothetical protein